MCKLCGDVGPAGGHPWFPLSYVSSMSSCIMVTCHIFRLHFCFNLVGWLFYVMLGLCFEDLLLDWIVYFYKCWNVYLLSKFGVYTWYIDFLQHVIIVFFTEEVPPKFLCTFFPHPLYSFWRCQRGSVYIYIYYHLLSTLLEINYANESMISTCLFLPSIVSL